jgi:hypothetical protein
VLGIARQDRRDQEELGSFSEIHPLPRTEAALFPFDLGDLEIGDLPPRVSRESLNFDTASSWCSSSTAVQEELGSFSWRLRYATVETVTFSPIPCWTHLSPELYRARIAALVEFIETEAARARERTGASVVGVEAILSRDPQHRPAALARSSAPRVHAAAKAARRAFYEIYAAFVSTFREASERLRGGDRGAPFPAGSFPPALPFVAG